MFYASNLSEEDAHEIATAYYKAERDPRKIAKILGVVAFDVNLMKHPLVKRTITKMAIRMRETYSLEDHLSKLQEIRDMALEDGNYRIALSAEISVGKAAGLYERVADINETTSENLNELSTDELRKRLTQLGAPGAAAEAILLNPQGGDPDYEPEDPEF